MLVQGLRDWQGPGMQEASIRLARPDELHLVLRLEDSAGQRYAKAGLPPDLEGLSPKLVAQGQAEGLLWFILIGEEPVGFALCWHRPMALHLRELDVHPDWMGRGLGRRLVEHVVEHAKHAQLPTVTLTTFRDVFWNAPLYRRWGFVDIAPQHLPPWLQSIRNEEDAGDLHPWPRVAMARRVAVAVEGQPPTEPYARTRA